MTNKVVLRDIDEFMADYTPVYQPLYPLFMSKAQGYSEQVGKVNFKRLEAVGDIRQKHITPKDTEMKQIAVKESSKTFKKYFLANQYVQSALQSQDRVEDVIRQVLDEHQKQADEIFLLGEGTSASDVVNNGLYWSGDSNYILNSSAEVALASDNHLNDFHAKIVAQAAVANKVSGRKVVIFYGDTTLSKFNAVYSSQPVPFKRVLADVLGANYSFAEMPTDITPASAEGFIIVNMDQVKMHYTALPALKAQGINDEKMYSWHNFLMGSMMLEILASGATIRQPLTYGS